MNLLQAHERLSCLSCLIARKGADPVVSGKIYVAAVIGVLLHGSETWVWTFSMLNTMHGFHHRACQRLAGKWPRRWQNDTWEYCSTDEAIEFCKLLPIQVYIAGRRQYTLAYVVKRPIYKLCRGAVRSPGTPTRTQFWWEQDLSHLMQLEKDESPKGWMIHDAGV